MSTILKRILDEKVNEVIEKTGLSNVKNRRISALSKGYKQRLGIAQALLGNPKVIILDEPTVGLDPIQIIEIRDLIKNLGKTHTVIFSSHILSEVQAICDQIIMIAGGKLVAFGKPEELQKQLLAPNEIILTTDIDKTEIDYILAKIKHITEITIEPNESKFTIAHIKSDCKDIYDLSASVFRSFSKNKKVIYEMTLKKGNLEDVFIELSGNLETNIDKKDINKATTKESEEDE